MKFKCLLCLVPLGFSGCAGFNTVLFMTKSNVGLDIDGKPPTAEINIARKEGVVEPVFEGGKTPPVMASFSSKTGSGGMSRFFLGVNQTFAGGDAAVTMAKLYDSKEKLTDTGPNGIDTNRARFDSGLVLSKIPNANRKPGVLGWRKRLFGLQKEGEVRPFFFGTDTQLGVKVAWNGVGGPYPDTIKVGFNRKEMAVAPVTVSNNVVRIPSFLATVDSDVTGTVNTNAAGPVKAELGVGWLQYFATGDSANYLSRQFGVRKAMLERADPKAEAEQRFQTFRADFVTQRDMYYAVIGHYSGGNQAKKDKILQLAKDHNVVPAATTHANFEINLNLSIPGNAAHGENLKKLIAAINQ